MKKIITPLFVACLSFSTLAAAETAEQLEDFKHKLVGHIDGEIAILTQFKTCIQAAKNRPDFEACNNAQHEAQKKKMVEMKKEQLETHKKQLAIEEKQLTEIAKPEKK